MAAALPRADGRRVADGAAAVQQRRADGAAGAGGRARRHAVAAHQLARRGAGAADRGGGDAGAAHAADHRARDRRDRRRRSARRLVLRRAADAATSRTRRWPTSRRSTAWAAWSRRSSTATRSARSPRAPTAFQQAVERREQIIVGVNDFVEPDDAAASARCTSTRPPGERSWRRLDALRARRDDGQVRQALDGAAGRRPGTAEYDAAAARRRPGLRHGRRNVRRAARGLGRIRGDADNLRPDVRWSRAVGSAAVSS